MKISSALWGLNLPKYQEITAPVEIKGNWTRSAFLNINPCTLLNNVPWEERCWEDLVSSPFCMCFLFYFLLISWAKQRRKLASLPSEFHYLQIFLIQDNASLAGSWDSSIKNFPPFSHQWAFVTSAFLLGTQTAKKLRSLFSPFCVTVAVHPQILCFTIFS